MPDPGEQEALAGLKGKIAGRIVWESNRDGSWQLYTMNADGTGARRLLRAEGDCTQAQIAADGKTVLYTHELPGKPPQLRLVGVDGGGDRTLVDNAAMGVWRRGGRAVQFLRRPQKGKDRWETREYDLSSGNERLLFPRPGIGYEPEVHSGIGDDEGARFVIWSPKPRGTWVVSPDGRLQAHVHGGCEGQVAEGGRYGYGVFRAGRLVRFNLSDGGDMQTMLELKGPWDHTYFPRVPAGANWLIYGACPPDQHNQDVSDYELFLVPLIDWKASGRPVRLTFNSRTDRWPDLWLAPPGEGNPLPDGPYDVASNRATNPPPPLWLFSFSRKDAKPEFGGDWGLWPQEQGCRGEATFMDNEDAEGGKGGSMKIDYDISAAPRSFSLWMTAGPRKVDLSAYDRFVVYARGSVPSFTLVVKDQSAGDPDAPDGIAESGVGELTDDWRRFEVLFRDFVPRRPGARIDWRTVNHVGICAIAPQDAESGTIWVDNLRAESGEVPN